MSTSSSHSFNIETAIEYGVECALLIHHFQHWININIRSKRNSHEGKTWMYQTIDDIHEQFPYMKKEALFDIIFLLCNGHTRYSEKILFEPVLVKGNFNKTKYDRTVWYAFKNEKKFTILGIPKMEAVDLQNGDCGSPTPIPDTKTDTKTKASRQAEKPSEEVEKNKELLEQVKGLDPMSMMHLARSHKLEDLEKAVTMMRHETNIEAPHKWIASCIRNKWWEERSPVETQVNTLYDSMLLAIAKLKSLNKEITGILDMKAQLTIGRQYEGQTTFKKNDFEDLERIKEVLKVLNVKYRLPKNLYYSTISGKIEVES